MVQQNITHFKEFFSFWEIYFKLIGHDGSSPLHVPVLNTAYCHKYSKMNCNVCLIYITIIAFVMQLISPVILYWVCTRLGPIQ